MKVVLQKVLSASVAVDQKTVGEISYGYMLLVAIAKTDTAEKIDWLVHKIYELRLFGDDNSFMQHNITQVSGSILIIPQFTLYGEIVSGTRPDFALAAQPKIAIEQYQYFVQACTTQSKEVAIATGKFGANMNISVELDGPVTLLLER